MSKSQKPKRKFDPSRALHRSAMRSATNIQRARSFAERKADAMPLAPGALLDLGIAYHSAIVLLRDRGGEDYFHTLAAALNIAGRFCNAGIGQEYSTEITASIAALERIRTRGKTTGRWVLDGDALKAISRALDIHDAQMTVVTCGQLREAITEVYALNEAQLSEERLAA